MFATIKLVFVSIFVLFFAVITLYPAYFAAAAFYVQTNGWGGPLGAFGFGFLVWSMLSWFLMSLFGLLK